MIPLCASSTTLWCHLLNMVLTLLPIVQFPRALWLRSFLNPHLMLNRSFISGEPVPAFWPPWLAVCQKRHCLPPGCFSMAWPRSKMKTKENCRKSIKGTFCCFLNRLLLVTGSMVLSTELVFQWCPTKCNVVGHFSASVWYRWHNQHNFIWSLYPYLGRSTPGASPLSQWAASEQLFQAGCCWGLCRMCPFVGGIRILQGSMAHWGPGWCCDKIRSKVKLRRQATKHGPVQWGPWLGTGMAVRELQAGKPMCACVLQEGLMALGGAEIWFWSHGQEWESRGGLLRKVRTGSALMALVIDTNRKYTSPVSALKQDLPLFWSKPPPGHAYCKGFLCCVCVCQIIVHYKNMKVPS